MPGSIRRVLPVSRRLLLGIGFGPLWSVVLRAPNDGGGGGGDQQQQQQQDQGQQQQDKGQQQQEQGQQQDKGQQQDQLPGFLHQASPEVREALKSHGFKTFDDMGKKLLDLDKNAGADRIVLPGEKATPEELAAFHHKIGVPTDAKEYALEWAEGPDGKPDTTMDAWARDTFPKAGVTKAGASILNKSFNELMGKVVKANQEAVAVKLAQGEEAWAKKNGAAHAANQDIATRAATFAGFTPEEVKGLKQIVGVEKAMGMFLAYGNAVATDGEGPTGGSTFNITTKDQAQAELDRMKADKSIGAILRDAGHKEHAAVKAKWNRLTDQVAGIKT